MALRKAHQYPSVVSRELQVDLSPFGNSRPGSDQVTAVDAARKKFTRPKSWHYVVSDFDLIPKIWLTEMAGMTEAGKRHEPARRQRKPVRATVRRRFGVMPAFF
jgi:hypothetical protein